MRPAALLFNKAKLVEGKAEDVHVHEAGQIG